MSFFAHIKNLPSYMYMYKSLQLESITAHVPSVLNEYVYNLMMMSFLAHSFISSFSSIMCAMDYMYNTTEGTYHCTCCMSMRII